MKLSRGVGLVKLQNRSKFGLFLMRKSLDYQYGTKKRPGFHPVFSNTSTFENSTKYSSDAAPQTDASSTTHGLTTAF